jgi:hypothetical protein
MIFHFLFLKESASLLLLPLLHVVGETGLGGVEWIGLAQDRNKWRAAGSIKCRETLEWCSAA